MNSFLKDFSKFFLGNDYGLKSIAFFLNDAKFIEKILNSSVNVFGFDTRIIKQLIANLTGFNKHDDDLFKVKCKELNFSLIKSINLFRPDRSST